MTARAIQFEFVPVGTVASGTPGHFYLDVGNASGPTVFDQHCPGSAALSSTGLVRENLEALSTQMESCHHLVGVTHEAPDVDAISATWMAARALEGKPLSDGFIDALAAYVDMADQGLLAINAEAVSLDALVSVDLDFGSALASDQAGSDLQRLMRGHEVLDVLHASGITDFSDIPASAPLRNNIWARTASFLARDRCAFEQDMANAEVSAVYLPMKDGTGTAAVDFAAVRKPRSQFFKSWARSHDSFTRGPLTMIEHSDSRVVFSVPPDEGVFLRGLGDMLQDAERKCQTSATCPNSANLCRPGYDDPDPWYDGRGTAHNYTIVDAPRSGTGLTWQALRTILAEYLASWAGN